MRSTKKSTARPLSPFARSANHEPAMKTTSRAPTATPNSAVPMGRIHRKTSGRRSPWRRVHASIVASSSRSWIRNTAGPAQITRLRRPPFSVSRSSKISPRPKLIGRTMFQHCRRRSVGDVSRSGAAVRRSEGRDAESAETATRCHARWDPPWPRPVPSHWASRLPGHRCTVDLLDHPHVFLHGRQIHRPSAVVQTRLLLHGMEHQASVLERELRTITLRQTFVQEHPVDLQRHLVTAHGPPLRQARLSRSEAEGGAEGKRRRRRA